MKRITLGDWEENIEPKTPEEEDGCAFLEPKSSETNEEESFWLFFPSIPHLSCIPKHHSNIKMTTSTLEITKVRLVFLIYRQFSQPML